MTDKISVLVTDSKHAMLDVILSIQTGKVSLNWDQNGTVKGNLLDELGPK